MAENFHYHVSPKFPPPSSPDLNPMDFYVWGVVERDSDNRSQNTVAALRAVIVDAMSKIPKTHLITVCSRFRQRIEADIAAIESSLNDFVLYVSDHVYGTLICNGCSFFLYLFLFFYGHKFDLNSCRILYIVLWLQCIELSTEYNVKN